MERTAPDIAAYQEWERRAGPSLRTRYVDFMPHEPLFEVRPNDVPVTLPGYRIQPSGPTLATVTASGGQSVTIRGLSADAVALGLSRVDGRKSVQQIAQAAPPRWPVAAWCTLLQVMLGKAVDLPVTFSAYLIAVDHREIVRFPAQPAYTLLRNYWENAAVVRRQLPEFHGCLGGSERFLAALARLHVLATTGNGGKSFYGGYGLIPTVPGGYREIGVQTAIPETLVRTLDHWSALLGAGLVSCEGELRTSRGQAMSLIRENGTIVQHLATGAALSALLDEARAALVSAHEARRQGRTAETLRHLAAFHQIFVNSHPFANINHSIAMNIVNDCLRAAGLGPVPHLFLDYLAQRLPPDRYAPAFAGVVELYALPVNDAAARDLSYAASAALYSRYRADRDGVSGTASTT
jgi:hypothetical protein